MSLSCSCDYEHEMELGDWCYWWEDALDDFKPLATSRRKRCCSCKELIDIGALCIELPRMGQPHNEISARIMGVDPECLEEPCMVLAPHYHCEKCGEIYLNLTSIGYDCLGPNESMAQAMKDYQEIVKEAKAVKEAKK